MKKITAILIALALITGFTACKNKTEGDNTQEPTTSPVVSESPSASPSESGDPTDSPDPSTDPTESPKPTEPPEEGFKAPDENMRPWAVSIDNQGSKPFPQGGLEDAQIVYELPVEGGLTRYMALFWDVKVDLVGPVRSARDYMLDIFVPYDGILVHVGGSPQALADIKNNPDIDYLNAMINAGYIFEELNDDPSDWQDTYTTGEKISDFLSTYAITTATEKSAVPKYHEEMTEGDNGLNANTISITYNKASKCAYIYDAKMMMYFRNRDGESHIDRNSNKPIGVANIIIQKVDSRIITGDAEGRLEVDMVGEGEGYFISGGKSKDITWEKAERFGSTVYFDSDGNEIVLNPGNTWIQVTVDSTAILIL